MKCRGKLDEAIRLFRKATELKPDNAAAYRNLVSALVRQGKRAEAVAVGRTAIELKPNDAKSYNILAWLLATATETEALDPGRAVELAQKAVELAPQDGDFWNTLGVAQLRGRLAGHHRGAQEVNGTTQRGG